MKALTYSLLFIVFHVRLSVKYLHVCAPVPILAQRGGLTLVRFLSPPPPNQALSLPHNPPFTL